MVAAGATLAKLHSRHFDMQYVPSTPVPGGCSSSLDVATRRSSKTYACRPEHKLFLTLHRNDMSRERLLVYSGGRRGLVIMLLAAVSPKTPPPHTLSYIGRNVSALYAQQLFLLLWPAEYNYNRH